MEQTETREPVEGEEGWEYPKGEGQPDDDGDASSIEDLAGGAEEPEEPAEPPVEGTVGQLNLDVAGEAPNISTAKLEGKSMEVEGQFDRQEVVTFTVMARCRELDLIDTLDAQGYVTKVERRHVFRIESIRRA